MGMYQIPALSRQCGQRQGSGRAVVAILGHPGGWPPPTLARTYDGVVDVAILGYPGPDPNKDRLPDKETGPYSEKPATIRAVRGSARPPIDARQAHPA